VQSKYVAAFQETCTGFTTRFPDQHAFHRVEWPDNDPSRILTVIDAHHEQSAQLKKLHTHEHWPLAGIAQLSGHSLLAVWGGMVNQTDGRIIASSGATEDRQKERDILTRTSYVVLDLTALLTLWHLKLHERVTRRFEKVFVAQAVLDEVNKEIAWQYLGGQPSGIIGKEGDKYFFRHFSPEVLRHQRDFLENIRDFIESATEVVPVPYALEIGKDEFESLQDIVGEGTIASVLIAKAQGIPLYADDLRLRKMAQHDWQVEGIWTQTILTEMHEEMLLTDEEYHEAVRWLALAHYHFVSIRAVDLLWLLQQNTMQITEEVLRIFACLQGPECNEESAMTVLTNLIKAVWLEPLTDYQKSSILDLALSTLTTGRTGRSVIKKLERTIQSKFSLIPIHGDIILQNVNLWCQQKLLK
jgi:hypothetical protein